MAVPRLPPDLGATLDAIGALAARPDDDARLDAAARALLAWVRAAGNDPFAQAALESALSTDHRIAHAYFQTLAACLSQRGASAPGSAEAWAKTCGLAFHFADAHAFGTWVPLPEADRDEAEQVFGTRCGATVAWPGFGLAISDDTRDLPPIGTLLGMAHVPGYDPPPLDEPLFPASGPALVVVAARVSLPCLAAPTISSWDAFNTSVAAAAEAPPQRDEPPIRLHAPALSHDAGLFSGGSDLPMTLGTALTRAGAGPISSLLHAALTSGKDTPHHVELVLEPGLGPALGGLAPTGLTMHVRVNGQSGGDARLFDTWSPAFVVGYLTRVFTTLLPEGSDIRVVDRRHRDPARHAGLE